MVSEYARCVTLAGLVFGATACTRSRDDSIVVPSSALASCAGTPVLESRQRFYSAGLEQHRVVEEPVKSTVLFRSFGSGTAAMDDEKFTKLSAELPAHALSQSGFV